ncbi:hypothetical protein ACFWWS_37605 [Streptomyces sp. NPDC059083]|uniref:hypothetical protein n=1 Tax=Streptomyces sp. NPDC059083 TaxID=3346721 RepID=UPI00367540AD
MLLASNQAVLDSERPWFMGLDLLDEGDGDLLTVPIPEQGWVNTAATHRLYRPWVGERVASTAPETMERVGEALRPSLEL